MGCAPVQLLVLLSPEGEDAGEQHIQQHAGGPDVGDLALVPVVYQHLGGDVLWCPAQRLAQALALRYRNQAQSVKHVSHSVLYRLSLCGHQEPLVTLLHRQLSAAACASQSDALPKAATADAVDFGTAQPSCPQPHPSDAQKLQLELELTSPGPHLIIEGRNQAHKGQHTEESCAPVRPWSSRSRTASAARRASRGRLPAAHSPAAGAEGDHGDASLRVWAVSHRSGRGPTSSVAELNGAAGMRGMEMTRAGARKQGQTHKA